MNDEELIAWHKTLVETPSLSHNERAIADLVEARLREAGAEVWRVGDNVIARAGEGPRILLNSHFDTVPANAAWTRDPWKADVEDGRIFGLGSNDAKASVAAMTAAFIDVVQQGGPCETVLMLVPEEETGGNGTETALPWLQKELNWKPQGAIVGEPTNLQIGTEQKGLMILELAALGDACHAANAGALNAVNPVWQLAEDLAALMAVDLGEKHPKLGSTTLQPTVLSGAAVHNQVPAEASAILDVRTVPGLSHAEICRRIRGAVTGVVRERSTRLAPYACAEDAPIVAAALAARPGSKTFASPTMSDQTFFQGIHAVKCGPGVSNRSHTADEYVTVEELLEGASFYRAAIRSFSLARAGSLI